MPIGKGYSQRESEKFAKGKGPGRTSKELPQSVENVYGAIRVRSTSASRLRNTPRIGK